MYILRQKNAIAVEQILILRLFYYCNRHWDQTICVIFTPIESSDIYTMVWFLFIFYNGCKTAIWLLYLGYLVTSKYNIKRCLI